MKFDNLFREETKKAKYSKYPRIDTEALAFADNESIENMQIEYIKRIRKIVLRRCMIVIVLIALCLFGAAIAGGYAVGAAYSPYTSASPSQDANYYVLNTNTKKFHKPSCSSVQDMKESNKKEVDWERSKVISRGYSPCGKCNP